MSHAQHMPMTTDVTYGHACIRTNLIVALGHRLRGRPFQPGVSGMRLPTIHGRYRYPDAMVTSTPPALDALEVTEPIVIFEVMSDSAAKINWTDKMVEYCALPSVQRYVMLEQNRPFATSIGRLKAGWSFEVMETGTLSLPELDLGIPLAELYEGLELTRPDTTA